MLICGMEGKVRCILLVVFCNYITVHGAKRIVQASSQHYITVHGAKRTVHVSSQNYKH